MRHMGEVLDGMTTSTAVQAVWVRASGASWRPISLSGSGDHNRPQNREDAGMTIKSGDPKLGAALDAVSEALKKIYGAKRDGTATAKDDIRLKKLHVEWMAIMCKIGDGEAEGLRQPTILAAQNESRDSASFLARLREGSR